MGTMPWAGVPRRRGTVARFFFLFPKDLPSAPRQLERSVLEAITVHAGVWASSGLRCFAFLKTIRNFAFDERFERVPFKWKTLICILIRSGAFPLLWVELVRIVVLQGLGRCRFSRITWFAGLRANARGWEVGGRRGDTVL